MANDTPSTGILNPQQVLDNNNKIAATVKNQGIDDLAAAGPDDVTIGNSNASLDELMKKAEEDAKKAAEEVIVEKKPEVVSPPAKPDESPSQPSAEDLAKKKADDLFKDLPSLPPNASPKSHEAFATIKIKAAQDISTRDEQIGKLQKELEDLKKTSANPTPEQLETDKELKELRAWRQRLDIDFDPAFKTFDSKIEKIREFIYAQLRKSPAIDESVIESIKKYGGPENVEFKKIWEKAGDDRLQRLVEGQLSELEKIAFEKQQAIINAKGNLENYLSDRQKQLQGLSVSHQTSTQTELNSMLNSLEWWKTQTAKSDADETAKKLVEDHNKFLTEAQQQVKEALTDDSPKMRAILITGTLQLFNLQRVHAQLTAQYKALDEAFKDVSTKYEKVKNSGKSRLEQSQAPSSGALPQPRKDTFNVRADDALDAIAKQVTEEYNSKLGAKG